MWVREAGARSWGWEVTRAEAAAPSKVPHLVAGCTTTFHKPHTGLGTHGVDGVDASRHPRSQTGWHECGGDVPALGEERTGVLFGINNRRVVSTVKTMKTLLMEL